MKTRIVVLTVGLLVPCAANASDAPHDLLTAAGITCDSCHILHNAPGGAVTTVAGNYNLCMSCHASHGTTFNWPLDYQATPGARGRSHRWDAPAVSSLYGAQAPSDPEMLKRLPGGILQCSTCHDQHTGANSFKGTQRVSAPVGSAIARTGGAGTGTLVLNQPAAAATAKGYRIDVVTAGAVPAATFRVSSDNGLSWFGWNGSAWQAGLATGRPTGASVALNDGTNVTVTFAGTFAVGDSWSFYVSYPFLRAANDQGQLCESCHVQRVQTTAYFADGGDGVKVFSHPVGEALTHAYDRAGGILDADGNLQTTPDGGDGIASNNLNLDTLGNVRCTTCHNPHNADSNSLTEDLR